MENMLNNNNISPENRTNHKFSFACFRSYHKIVTKAINKHDSYLWKEVINEIKVYKGEKKHSSSESYLFSKGLTWGKYSISAKQISRRWKAHVKDKLNISADFYALKHAYLDKVSEVLSLKEAQKLASHTSEKMLLKHYATGEGQREMDRLKEVEIPFIDDAKMEIV